MNNYYTLANLPEASPCCPHRTAFFFHSHCTTHTADIHHFLADLFIMHPHTMTDCIPNHNGYTTRFLFRNKISY